MNNIPNHVAIIMDGNGRWATEKGLKRSEGHKAGGKTLEKLALYAKKIGIKILSVYAFSTDNFKRSKEEVDFLMDLLIYYFNEKLDRVCNDGIKIVFSGRKDHLRKDVLIAMNNIIERTKNNNECTLNICLNYGGHSEIVDATKEICQKVMDGQVNVDDVNEEMFNSSLYQDLPPIDLLIRTSGEYRISNYMLWQLSYSELYFTNVLFPDFDEKEFDKAVLEYYQRDRKFGGVKNEE